MKKITVFIALSFLFVIAGNSQRTVTWFYLGLKGGGGISMLYNNPSFNDTKITYNYLSPSYFYGASLGFLFGQNIGISAEIAMNTLSQKYDVNTGHESFSSDMLLNTFDYGILLSLQSSTGLYFNIGPKFSNLKKATYHFISDKENTTNDRTAKLVPSFNSLIVEAGFMPIRTNLFVMDLGLRATYGFSNIVDEAGYIIPTDDKKVYFPAYLDEKTNPIQLMLSVEFKYYFGRYGRASCGKYNFLFNRK